MTDFFSGLFQGLRHKLRAAEDYSHSLETGRWFNRFAVCDELTGVYNRRSFRYKLEGLLRGFRGGASAPAGASHVLFTISIGSLREINKVYGLEAGDQTLQILARRLKGFVSGTALLGRLGDKDFAILMPCEENTGDIKAVARTILQKLNAPIKIGSLLIRVNVSIGGALFPLDAARGKGLLVKAFSALDRAKVQFGEKIFLFDLATEAEEGARHYVAQELSRALSAGDIVNFYQPQVDITSGHLTGVESLARWDHKELGVVSPDRFVSIAEQSGLILELGEYVLRRACFDAVHFPCGVRMCVNVSPLQFTYGHFCDFVSSCLSESGLAPSRLELEITESVLVEDEGLVRSQLNGLKSLGVSIAVDDFGSGYSSFGLLQRFAFDKIKIDKRFVECLERDLKSRTIMGALLGMGSGLGLPVLVEGAENAAQVSILRELGCRYIQGYFFGSALSFEDFLSRFGSGDNLLIMGD